ncbi:uncharacterized protein BJ171DRAFT_91563 [Polychytrium aggregatum]|uniref:uncharacterized protein n=1 Tax=Polychytrium aggregatum TaxID=110093 RepID=UPI0022FF2489|nr:uncharacterized protein BJ171DRAFT_91563 [Polychytrium aggregatum]KAI9204912.1 hypothetical protein BJ171DRAFT_91563 [Polychytrium aggregatum]
MWYPIEYDPIRAGNIDGSAKTAHDSGVLRAARHQAKQTLQKSTSTATTTASLLGQLRSKNPYKTLFVARLSPQTMEDQLRAVFKTHGPVRYISIARDVVTGISRCYGFVEFESQRDCERAYQASQRLIIDDRTILVDYERARLMQGWIPRRLGGGLGGKKESGQLRFGGRGRPFRMPIGDNAGDTTIRPEQRNDDCWREHAIRRSKGHSNDRQQSTDLQGASYHPRQPNQRDYDQRRSQATESSGRSGRDHSLGYTNRSEHDDPRHRHHYLYGSDRNRRDRSTDRRDRSKDRRDRSKDRRDRSTDRRDSRDRARRHRSPSRERERRSRRS